MSTIKLYNARLRLQGNPDKKILSLFLCAKTRTQNDDNWKVSPIWAGTYSDEERTIDKLLTTIDKHSVIIRQEMTIFRASEMK